MIPLKDQFFNEAFLQDLEQSLQTVGSKIDTKGILQEYRELELLDRMHVTADQVFESLNQPFPEALEKILIIGGQFTGFGAMVFPDIIERHGLSFPDLSLPALVKLTANSSSEFAIRPFIKQDLKGVLRTMEEWSVSDNHHVRRLASEGSRYKLPWSFKIQEFIENPDLTGAIINNLHKDSELYVKKSVANHLNDLSKEKSDYVLGVVNAWPQNGHSDWIKKHALRSLIKQGDKKALAAIGITPVPFSIETFELEKADVPLGEDVVFSLKVRAKPKAELNIDYAIHFMKANGSLTRKVFKLSKFQMSDSGEKTFSKKHRIEQLSTRKIYPGRHGLSLIVNGEELDVVDFEVGF